MTSRMKFVLLPGILGVMTLAQSATGTVLFDASLSSPGVYYGVGNPNGGFTIDTENGIELGLRAKLRLFSGTVIDSPTDVYDVPVGVSPIALNRAAWNYDFSINLAPGGVASDFSSFAGLTANLTITDTVTGKSFSFDPLTIPDNALFGTTGAQNSENALAGGFGFGDLAANYNVNAVDSYRFDLTLNSGLTTIASDTIFVNTQTPEPSTIGLTLGGGLLLLLGRRSRSLLRK